MFHKNCLPTIVVLIGLISTSLYGQDKSMIETTLGKDVELWMQGLNDASYRVRRESFLKLCDRSIPIDKWLEVETRNADKHRAAIAIWLQRFRRSKGTLAERMEMLQDYEALRSFDDRVLEKYSGSGQWERLIELISLLDPPLRMEFLTRDRHAYDLVNRAWETDSEMIVPRFLDLVLKPNERIYANRLWRKLGMPEQWQVSEESSSPTTKIIRAEADGHIDDAIKLARSSAMLQFLEPILMRAGRWEDWLALDAKRIPIMGQTGFEWQRVAMLLALGQNDEAKASLEKALASQSKSNASVQAFLALGLGDEELFQLSIQRMRPYHAFQVLRFLGRVDEAFAQIGLKELDTESIEAWLGDREYEKQLPTVDTDDQFPANPHLVLIEYADYLFQLGLKEEGELIDSYVINEITRSSISDVSYDWQQLFYRWINLNERDKALYYLKRYLTDHGLSNRPSDKKRLQRSSNDSSVLAEFYPELSQSKDIIFRFLIERADDSVANGARPSDEVERDWPETVRQSIDAMEDLTVGRLPPGWTKPSTLLELRQFVLDQDRDAADSQSQIFELAKLFDELGETQLALNTLELCYNTSTVIEAKAKYMTKLGDPDGACDLLLSLVQQGSANLAQTMHCMECLEKVGRYGDLDRLRAKEVSMVLYPKSPLSDLTSFDSVPLRQEAQMKLEHMWQTNDEINAMRLLRYQFAELAEKDLKYASQAGHWTRLEYLVRAKSFWSSEQRAPLRELQFLGYLFQPMILEAIALKDQAKAETLFQTAFRFSPREIELPIAVIPAAEKVFGKEIADRWFQTYYQPMLEHAQKYPHDSLIGNNTAWLAASCNRELKSAQQLASHVVEIAPEATYMDTLAEVEYRLGNVKRAIELSEKCRELEPKEKQHRNQLRRFQSGKP